MGSRDQLRRRRPAHPHTNGRAGIVSVASRLRSRTRPLRARAVERGRPRGGVRPHRRDVPFMPHPGRRETASRKTARRGERGPPAAAGRPPGAGPARRGWGFGGSARGGRRGGSASLPPAVWGRSGALMPLRPLGCSRPSGCPPIARRSAPVSRPGHPCRLRTGARRWRIPPAALRRQGRRTWPPGSQTPG